MYAYMHTCDICTYVTCLYLLPIAYATRACARIYLYKHRAASQAHKGRRPRAEVRPRGRRRPRGAHRGGRRALRRRGGLGGRTSCAGGKRAAAPTRVCRVPCRVPCRPSLWRRRAFDSCAVRRDTSLRHPRRTRIEPEP